MNWLYLVTFLILLGANEAIYRWHKGHIPRAADEERTSYTLSWSTRAFHVAKYLVPSAAVLHIVLEAFWWMPQDLNEARFALGVGLGLTSLALLHWSLKTLGNNFAACDRGLMPKERIRSGPYRFTGHPIYLSNFLLMVGIAVASFGPLIAAVLMADVFFYTFSIRDEERALSSLENRP